MADEQLDDLFFLGEYLTLIIERSGHRIVSSEFVNGTIEIAFTDHRDGTGHRFVGFRVADRAVRQTGDGLRAPSTLMVSYDTRQGGEYKMGTVPEWVYYAVEHFDQIGA